MTENNIKLALNELYRRVGTQQGLASLAGITQSTVCAYLSGKAKVENMPLRVFLKLFRDIRIDFFGENTGDAESDLIRRQLLEVFDALSPEEQINCLSIVIANFPENVKKKGKQ